MSVTQIDIDDADYGTIARHVSDLTEHNIRDVVRRALPPAGGG
ncbi:hypothetical protein [Streptomyces graminilatus]|nr:hypothetical protein [Streptomyces graminilatus]